jgi:hypothetical protein
MTYENGSRTRILHESDNLGVVDMLEVPPGDMPPLHVHQPAGFERFVAAVSRLDEPAPETLAAVAAEHDIEILGPPGTLP